MYDDNWLYYAADRVLPIFDELNNWAIKDIIARLVTNNFELSGTAEYRTKLLQDSGVHLQEIIKEISLVTKKSEKELKKIFEDAGIKEINYINKSSKMAGHATTSLSKSQSLINALDMAYKATSGELRNFTQSMAVASQSRYIEAVDKAYMSVSTGMQNYNEAIKNAVNDVAKEGIVIKYPSGHQDSVETAVRRSVLAGVNKGTNDIALAQAQELGEDLILTSQHLGARTATKYQKFAYEDHSSWQGKVFSISGKNTKYPPFYENTGYGTGGGLGGWGCRHHTTIFFEGVSEIPKPLDTEENKKFEEARSKQRYQERQIRANKRQLQGIQSAIDNTNDDKLKFELQQSYDKKANSLTKKNKNYKEFCKDNDLKTDTERLRVAKWDREAAQKVAQGGKRYNAVGSVK